MDFRTCLLPARILRFSQPAVCSMVLTQRRLYAVAVLLHRFHRCTAVARSWDPSTPLRSASGSFTSFKRHLFGPPPLYRGQRIHTYLPLGQSRQSRVFSEPEVLGAVAGRNGHCKVSFLDGPSNPYEHRAFDRNSAG